MSVMVFQDMCKLAGIQGRFWICPDLLFFLTQEAAEDGVAVLLLGNKTDCAAQRQVPTKEGECLAGVGGEAQISKWGRDS